MKALRVLLPLPLALLLLFVGVYAGGHPENLPSFVRKSFLVEEDPALRAEVLDRIDDDYYKKVDGDKLEERSLKGIVNGLGDRFSHYLTPQETRRFEDSLSGSFEGVGMSIEEVPRGLRIQQVFAGSPARRARLDKGDLITAVNGRSIAGESSDVSTARIKGKRGTSVRLEVVTPGSRPRTVRIRRARIEVPVARGRVVRRGGTPLGVVALTSFTHGAHGALRQQVAKVRRAGAKGIVLDLRGNGGGVLREAVLVASIFIEEGPVVSTRGRTKPERKFDAQGGAIPRSIPLVVLVDRGSASASEIVAGALRDRNRATVVGTRTFGKGVFQQVEPLSNGGLLDITAGSYYLPSGRTVSGKGIRPQVQARDKPKTARDEALPKALQTLRAKVR